MLMKIEMPNESKDEGKKHAATTAKPTYSPTTPKFHLDSSIQFSRFSISNRNTLGKAMVLWYRPVSPLHHSEAGSSRSSVQRNYSNCSECRKPEKGRAKCEWTRL